MSNLDFRHNKNDDFRRSIEFRTCDALLDVSPLEFEMQILRKGEPVVVITGHDMQIKGGYWLDIHKGFTFFANLSCFDCYKYRLIEKKYNSTIIQGKFTIEG